MSRIFYTLVFSSGYLAYLSPDPLRVSLQGEPSPARIFKKLMNYLAGEGRIRGGGQGVMTNQNDVSQY
jgi:hypothetical protein